VFFVVLPSFSCCVPFHDVVSAMSLVCIDGFSLLLLSVLHLPVCAKFRSVW